VQKQTIVRYVFWVFWFLIVPAALAVSIVVWCQHAGSTLGEFAATVRDQSIPAGIVLFTLAEMTLYYFRHYLPGVDPLGASVPSGLDRDGRREVEAAMHLVDETERLLARHDKTIEREVSPAERERVAKAIERLKALLGAEPFDVKRLREAAQEAHALVDQHLAPWRKSETREYIESIAFAVVIALGLRAVVVEAFKIPSGSMLPTLQIDDHIFVNKFIYGPTLPLLGTRIASNMPPDRADVIVFEFPDPDPNHEGQDFIKRVIALPGDTLEVNQGHPVLNGWLVPSCKVGLYPYGKNDGHAAAYGELHVEFLRDMAYLTVYEQGTLSGTEGPFKVGANEVYVMGDNRHNSHDSRRWRNGEGAGVPFENIRGRAMRVWWPYSRLNTPVMGDPTLPDGMPRELVDGVERCLSQRPANTTPPPPKAR
jgi:signal peptidase I